MQQAILGKKYECIEDVFDEDDSEVVLYKKGNVYTSELDGCITDESGQQGHWWTDETEDEFGNAYRHNLTQTFKKLD